MVVRLNMLGTYYHRRRRHFVCEDVACEMIRNEELDNISLISYRHMNVREINVETGRSITLLEDATKQ